jgi:hypothetical protein
MEPFVLFIPECPYMDSSSFASTLIVWRCGTTANVYPVSHAYQHVTLMGIRAPTPNWFVVL